MSYYQHLFIYQVTFICITPTEQMASQQNGDNHSHTERPADRQDEEDHREISQHHRID